MNYFKKHQNFSVFYENESGGRDSGEVLSDVGTGGKKEEIPVSQIQGDQIELDKKKGDYLLAQQKTITLSTSLQDIANKKVEAVLQSDLFRNIGDPDARKAKIQALVSEFMIAYKSEYESLKASLESVKPTPSKEDVAIELEMQESLAFEQFINNKKNEFIEKRKEMRKQRYLKCLILTGNEELDQKNQDLITKFSVDYTAIRKKVLEEHPEITDDVEAQKKEIRKIIDGSFIEYCEQNNIEIDTILLQSGEDYTAGSEEFADTVITDEYIQIDAKGSIFQAQEEFVDAAKDLAITAHIYQQETSKYEKVEAIASEEGGVYDLPQKVVELPVGESTSFLATSGSSETIYMATREPDGEYTLRFKGAVVTDIRSKEELQVVMDLSHVPVINAIFQSGQPIYKVLMKEYMGQPQKSPNLLLGFVDFLYKKLASAYEKRTLELKISGKGIGEDDTTFAFTPNPDIPPELRGQAIVNTLSANNTLQKEVLSQLREAKIIREDGFINLAFFPI